MTFVMVFSGKRLCFVEHMYARAVQQLPEGDAWNYESNSMAIGHSPSGILSASRLVEGSNRQLVRQADLQACNRRCRKEFWL